MNIIRILKAISMTKIQFGRTDHFSLITSTDMFKLQAVITRKYSQITDENTYFLVIILIK